MLHFFKFNSEVPTPTPARAVYAKRTSGKGWPEDCPPIRAANGFGWDVLAATRMVFRRSAGGWTLEDPTDLEGDWVFSPDDEAEPDAAPLTQRNAWFWERDQVLPHPISPHVYDAIRNQVKVSTFLFLRTDPNELLFIGDIPNLVRPFRVLSAVADTDWYPASYPWHCVLELDEACDEVAIEKDEPLCRLMLLHRDHYFAREMLPDEFGKFFERTQEWLARNGKGTDDEGTTDITGAYARQQRLARFDVIV